MGNSQLSEAWLAERLEQDLGKALLRRFEDAVEVCREVAVTLLRQLLEVRLAPAPCCRLLRLWVVLHWPRAWVSWDSSWLELHRPSAPKKGESR